MKAPKYPLFIVITSLQINFAKIIKEPQFDELLQKVPFFENEILSAGSREAIGPRLSAEDFRLASKVEDTDPVLDENLPDPIFLAQAFEGDIKITKDELAKNALKDSRKLWRKGKVPYVISNQYSQYERSVIAAAIQEYYKRTCIKFVPRKKERDYIYILKGNGCHSKVGRQKGRQILSLGRGCVYKGIVEHELMHAIGFWHEQSRYDRDSHVYINWQNILPSATFNFMKFSPSQISTLKAPYDTCSVMHYGERAFSWNGFPTITKRRYSRCKMGQRKGFSDLDVKKINSLYKCNSGGGGGGGGTSITTSKPKPDCQDTNEYCATWAVQGECKRNPGYMRKKCQIACKQCREKCADHHVHCDAWTARGECLRNPLYMNIYCRKSCGKC